MARTLLPLSATISICACDTLNERAAGIALRGGLAPETVWGTEFLHQTFHSREDSSAPLIVFVEGDGSPWLQGGTRVARDPTPHKPLALELAARTAGPVLYLARPCYYIRTANCTSDLWTSARYSPRVVQSMSVALDQFMAKHGYRSAWLVGYSGGGALAVLMAPHVEGVRAVITISANLDTYAWTALHDYLPLEASLNPAVAPPLPLGVSEWHIVGGKDHNVPPDLNAGYWARVPAGHVWRYERADHACCWVSQWPVILTRLRHELARASTTQLR